MNGQTGALWEQLAAPLSPYAPHTGTRTVDHVIIGAGLLGLSTALRLAQLGQDVALLESQQPGFGASGRNTGFVVPSLKSGLGPAEVRARLGSDEQASRLMQLVAGAGKTVFGLIETHGIDCAPTQNGWLQPGHTASAEAMLKARLPMLHDAGVDAEYLTRQDMHARTGLPRLHGGLRVRSGGQINPLAYARGLAIAAASAGASIHGDSHVRSLRQDGDHWRVETELGGLRARNVLLTTNAMAGNLSPPMRDAVIPVRVHQIATQPLDPDLRSRLLPDNAPVADTRRHTFALRWSEDGRLLTGGLVSPLPGRKERAAREFLARIRHHVPDCPPIRADVVWNGTIAATPDELPRMNRIARGLYGAIGCNGRGVALTTALGQELGRFLAGEVSETDFVLAVTPPRKVPARRLATLGPHLWRPISDLRDAIDTRNSRQI